MEAHSLPLGNPLVSPLDAPREHFEMMAAFVASDEARRMTHVDLELWLKGHGFELLRKLLQAGYDLMADDVVDEPVVSARRIAGTRSPRARRCTCERGLALEGRI